MSKEGKHHEDDDDKSHGNSHSQGSNSGHSDSSSNDQSSHHNGSSQSSQPSNSAPPPTDTHASHTPPADNGHAPGGDHSGGTQGTVDIDVGTHGGPLISADVGGQGAGTTSLVHAEVNGSGLANGLDGSHLCDTIGNVLHQGAGLLDHSNGNNCNILDAGHVGLLQGDHPLLAVDANGPVDGALVVGGDHGDAANALITVDVSGPSHTGDIGLGHNELPVDVGHICDLGGLVDTHAG